MRRLKPRRPSPALIISCIALFVAMGGVSYGFATGSIDSREIMNGGVTTNDIRNNEVRGRDIRNSTLLGRDVALDTLTGKDIKESTLEQVPSAAALGGVPSAGYVRKEPPAFRAIPLGTGIASADATPAYDIDGNGYVHLAGSYTGNAATEFTLPAGARPGTISRFPIARNGGGTDVLTITPAGDASTTNSGIGAASLDGVTFAAGG